MISFGGGGHRGNCGQTTWLQGHSEGESAGGVCSPSRVKRGIKHKIICSKHSVKVYRRWMTGSIIMQNQCKGKNKRRARLFILQY